MQKDKTMDLTPTEDLFMEVLAARWRLGEHFWTFKSQHKRIARSLESRNLIWWKSGIVEDTICAGLSDAGKEMYIYKNYVAPAAKDTA